MRVPNGDNILYNMYGYFNFLARTSQFVNQSYYSRQYMDASGLGSIFTVARLGENGPQNTESVLALCVDMFAVAVRMASKDESESFCYSVCSFLAK
jgi:hypothetical protein